MFRYIAIASGIMLVAIAGETPDSSLNRLLEKVLPEGKTLADYPSAKQELDEHIKLCGPGVVEGVEGENKCDHTVKIDDYFLKPIEEKTGLLHDETWPWHPNISWMTASKAEMENVPEQWDLSEHGKMIRIVRQNCGDCWAQASRANLEQLILTHTGVNLPLSTQTLISSCCNTGSCSGGYMSTPGWIVENGLPVLNRDPYKGSNSSCKFNFSVDPMDAFMMKSPYIGSSKNYSRAIKPEDRKGVQVANTQAMMIKYRSSAVVTIAAISQSGGIITSCSSINSGGNHMQDIVGWYENGGQTIARVQNSWGTDHGQNGYTHIRWECGDGQLNRGLGRSARVGVYNVPVECKYVPVAEAGKTRILRNSKGVRIGTPSKHPQKCSWEPAEGLDDPHSCTPIAQPKMPTEYHLTVETDCGQGSSMVLVVPMKKGELPKNKLKTPFGVIDWDIRNEVASSTQ